MHVHMYVCQESKHDKQSSAVCRQFSNVTHVIKRWHGEK
jgi:hypothetical protein